MITLKKYIVTDKWEEPGGGCDCSGEEIKFKVPLKIALEYAYRFAERDFEISAKLLKRFVVELDLCDELIEYYEEELGDYLYPEEE